MRPSAFDHFPSNPQNLQPEIGGNIGEGVKRPDHRCDQLVVIGFNCKNAFNEEQTMYLA